MDWSTIRRRIFWERKKLKTITTVIGNEISRVKNLDNNHISDVK